MSAVNLADLFSTLWRRLDKNLPQLIPTGWPPVGGPELVKLQQMMDEPTDGTVPAQILERFNPTLASIGRLELGQLEDLLLLGHAVDDWFAPLHPRIYGGNTSLDPARKYYRKLRNELGRYNSRDDGTWVVPKAPLRPSASDQPPTSTKIAGQFRSLSVGYLSAEAPRRVSVKVLRQDQDLEPVVNTSLKIAFIPLAEAAEDLSFTISKRGTDTFLDVGVTNEAALADRVERAIETACNKGAHLCILPELCVSPGIIKRIKSTLGRIGADSEIRLVVAGTGLHATTNGRSSNTCLVFDRIGRRLWQQDKINPYEMARSKLTEFEIATPGLDRHVEDIQPGEVLHVVDSWGFGRMMVLICEDLAQPDPRDRACEAVPPDWVFAPILDGSIGTGRWSHRKAYSIAESAHTRVVVANSMTLNARKAKPDPMNIGLCVDDAQPRRTRIIVTSGSSPVVAFVDWKSDTWEETTVGF